MGVATLAGAAIGAVGSVLSAKKQSKAAKANREQAVQQNEDNTAFIKEQAAKSRRDVLPLFNQAQQARRAGTQGALDVFGQTIPQQAQAFQQGNVGAQQALLAGLPQFQNAILGQQVDLSGLQPQQLDFDPSFAQQRLPSETPLAAGIGAPGGAFPTGGQAPGGGGALGSLDRLGNIFSGGGSPLGGTGGFLNRGIGNAFAGVGGQGPLFQGPGFFAGGNTPLPGFGNTLV